MLSSYLSFRSTTPGKAATPSGAVTPGGAAITSESATTSEAVSSRKTNEPIFDASRWHARKLQKDLPAPWFISREVDILFVCGLAPWLIGIVCFLVTGAGGVYPPTKFPQQILTLLFVAASLIIGESHQFTSIVRYYSSAFRKRTRAYKLQRIPIWFLYFLVAELVLFTNFSSMTVLLQWSLFLQALLLHISVIAFPAVLMQHVCAQASAIVQQYCRRADYAITRSEKCLLDAVSWLLVGTGACSIALPFGVDRNFGFGDMSFLASIQLSSYVLPLTALAAFACLVLAGYVVYRGLRNNDWPPLGAVLLGVNCAALILLAGPLPAMAYVWLFVPLFFHATQHWALAWSTQKREAKQESNSPSTGKVSIGEICKFIAPVMSLTVFVLFLPLMLKFAPPQFRAANTFFPGETLSVFFSMFVFYAHYFADRVVWRPKN